MIAANAPDFRLTLDGRDLTGTVRPRLISLSLSEKRGGEADQLDLTLDDSDGSLEIPPAGAGLTLQLGWRKGADVTPGLIDKGRFIVDQVEWSGPPDQIRVTARSADFTGNLTRRRDQSWHDTTIGAIVTELAGRNRLTPRCTPALAAIALASFAQSRESDIALLRRLGREHDALATIKAGTLLFAPIGGGATPGGQPLPGFTIRRRSGDRVSWRREKREEVKGVIAAWHDRKGAKKQEVVVGERDGAKRLARTYPTESAARTAAEAELRHGSRQPVSLDCSLALGRADLAPEQRVTATGFKPQIDAQSWLIAEVSHALSKSGFPTSLKLEGASCPPLASRKNAGSQGSIIE